MATIQTIKVKINDDIRSKTAPGSILRGNHSDIEDMLAHEIRDRGCLQLSSTDDLATASKDNTKLILIKTVGFFVALQTADVPDNNETFASADAGWLWEKILDIRIDDGSSNSGSSSGSGSGSGTPGEENELTFVEFDFSGDYEYAIPNGYMMDKLAFKSDSEEVSKIGLTDGGTEILLPDELNPFTAEVRKSISIDVFAEDGPVTLYFREWAGIVNVKLWLRKL
jgi:hypothetical protein